MRFSVLCVVAGMHEFFVVNPKSDQPLMQCRRCGRQQPLEPVVTERLFGPGGAGAGMVG